MTSAFSEQIVVFTKGLLTVYGVWRTECLLRPPYRFSLNPLLCLLVLKLITFTNNKCQRILP